MFKTVTDKTVNDIFTKDDWTDDATRKAVYSVRRYQKTLGFTEQWTAEYVYNVIVLAKREPNPSQEEVKKAEAKMKK
jgi:hypothetical protein